MEVIKNKKQDSFKNLKISFALITLLLISNALMAQVAITIGPPPAWGPAGYPEVQYYYIPDVEAYYDVQSSMFIYYGTSGWVHRSHLPYRYRNYNLYNGYKVVMTGYRGNSPYDHFNEHKRDYKRGGYQGERQKTYGEHPGNKNSGHDNSKKKKHD